MRRIILASSNKGDLVVDPFVGSGTTCVVANLLEREWIGIDINPDYIQMSQDRLKKEKTLFNSFDPREKRIPKDLNKSNLQASLQM